MQNPTENENCCTVTRCAAKFQGLYSHNVCSIHSQGLVCLSLQTLGTFRKGSTWPTYRELGLLSLNHQIAGSGAGGRGRGDAGRTDDRSRAKGSLWPTGKELDLSSVPRARVADCGPDGRVKGPHAAALPPRSVPIALLTSL